MIAGREPRRGASLGIGAGIVSRPVHKMFDAIAKITIRWSYELLDRPDPGPDRAVRGGWHPWPAGPDAIVRYTILLQYGNRGSVRLVPRNHLRLCGYGMRVNAEPDAHN